MFSFANWLLNIFVTIGGFLTKFVSRRFAIALAAVTIVITMTGTVWALLSTALAGLAISIPSEYVLMGMNALMPPNFEAVISYVVSLRITIWALNFNRDLLNMHLGGI